MSLTRNLVERVFDELTTHVYSAGRRHEIADVVEGLGTASNLEELIAILPTDLG